MITLKKTTLYSLVLAISLFFLSGCATPEELSLETSSKREGDVVEKVVLSDEDYFVDDMSLYEDNADSVVSMYLRLVPGNEADNTNHTWDEVSTYSTYYYSDNGLDRYNVNGILQIEDEFGVGVTVPNVAVQVRGQTSSKSAIKNYKIRIKDGMGSWRDQRSLALNKHYSDRSHLTNKLAYDLMSGIPHLVSARTQFVHLYICDQIDGPSDTWVDYGLYTQVEQINKTFLQNHGLDSSGQLYKVSMFEWYDSDDVMTPQEDENFDIDAFEYRMEIKGNPDLQKLQSLIDKVNNYSIPIETIVEEYFDIDNLFSWLGANILLGNSDSGARNLYYYSPLNSEKWYIIPWDHDASLQRYFHSLSKRVDGDSWERGMSQYLGMILFNRIFREPAYRQQLRDTVVSIHDNYINGKTVQPLIDKYITVTIPILYSSEMDLKLPRFSQEQYMDLISHIPGEIEDNYEYFLTHLENPWPFFVGIPQKEHDHLSIEWDASYDPNGELILYSFQLASDYNFENILFEQSDIYIPHIEFDMLPPGVYYMRVRSTNESGLSQDCFDYERVSGIGKVYACKAFYITPEGTIVEGQPSDD